MGWLTGGAGKWFTVRAADRATGEEVAVRLYAFDAEMAEHTIAREGMLIADVQPGAADGAIDYAAFCRRFSAEHPVQSGPMRVHHQSMSAGFFVQLVLAVGFGIIASSVIVLVLFGVLLGGLAGAAAGAG